MDINSLTEREYNKNAQINTFVGGMNSDTADAYLDSKQYRMAHNLRVTATGDKTAGELHPIIGTNSVSQELTKNFPQQYTGQFLENSYELIEGEPHFLGSYYETNIKNSFYKEAYIAVNNLGVSTYNLGVGTDNNNNIYFLPVFSQCQTDLDGNIISLPKAQITKGGTIIQLDSEVKISDFVNGNISYTTNYNNYTVKKNPAENYNVYKQSLPNYNSTFTEFYNSTFNYESNQFERTNGLNASVIYRTNEVCCAALTFKIPKLPAVFDIISSSLSINVEDNTQGGEILVYAITDQDRLLNDDLFSYDDEDCMTELVEEIYNRNIDPLTSFIPDGSGVINIAIDPNYLSIATKYYVTFVFMFKRPTLGDVLNIASINGQDENKQPILHINIADMKSDVLVDDTYGMLYLYKENNRASKLFFIPISSLKAGYDVSISEISTDDVIYTPGFVNDKIITDDKTWTFDSYIGTNYNYSLNNGGLIIRMLPNHTLPINGYSNQREIIIDGSYNNQLHEWTYLKTLNVNSYISLPRKDQTRSTFFDELLEGQYINPHTAATDEIYTDFLNTVQNISLNIGCKGILKINVNGSQPVVFNKTTTDQYYSEITPENNISGTFMYRVRPGIVTIFGGYDSTVEINAIEYEVAKTTYNVEGKILATASSGDILAYIIVDAENKWSLYTTTEDDILNGNKPKLIAGPFSEKIWTEDWEKDYSTKPISLYISYESKTNIKLFIADGIHKLFILSLTDGFLGYDFKTILKEQYTLLKDPQITLEDGGTIYGGVNQYAYILYSKSGSYSGLSAISKPISIYKDSTHGFAQDKQSNKRAVIAIDHLPIDSDLQIKLFRISYRRSGQEPTIDVIYDGYIPSNSTFYDNGQDINRISTSDLVLYTQDSVVPKLIESKDNYLFAANITYSQTKTDELFKDFDARCFNTGNTVNGQDVFEGITSSDSLATVLESKTNYLLQIRTDRIRHKQFDSGIYQPFDKNYWSCIGQSGFNGVGACFAWKYEYEDYYLNVYEQSSNVNVNSFRRNEVYRFGVRLFDKDGNASSVKWIADIKMPGWLDDDSDNNILPYIYSNDRRSSGLYARRLGVKFTPVNTTGEYSYLWDNVYAYQIVRCVKKLEDSYFVAQGMMGYPIKNAKEDSDQVSYSPAPFLTDSVVEMLSFPLTYGTGDMSHMIKEFLTPKFKGANRLWYDIPDRLHLVNGTDNEGNIIEFASPEYCYQKDDVNNILKSNSIYFNYVARLGVPSDVYRPYVIPIQSQYLLNERLNKNSDKGASLENDVQWVDAGDSTELENWFKWLTTRQQITGVTSPFARTDGKYLLKVIYNSPSKYVIDNKSLAMVETPDNKLHGNSESVTYEDYYGNIYTNWHGNNSDLNITQFTYDEYTGGRRSWFNIAMYGTIVYPKDSISNRQYVINRYSGVSEKNPTEFMDGSGNITAYNAAATIDGTQYYNWINPGLRYLNNKNNRVKDYYNNKDGEDDLKSLAYFWMSSYRAYEDHGSSQTSDWQMARRNAVSRMFTGAGSRKLLLKLNDTSGIRSVSSDIDKAVWDRVDNPHLPDIVIGTITKNAHPYGGYATSLYASGYAQHGNVVLMSDSNTDSSVFTGDCYIKIFTYNQSHYIYNAAATNMNSGLITYCVPVESNIDLQADFSNRNVTWPFFGGDKFELVQYQPFSCNLYSQSQPFYAYNTAYSVTPNVPLYYSIDAGAKQAEVTSYPNRISSSQKKYPNETIDSWLIFKAADFIDVNNKYGEITDLKLFKNSLLFWQQKATGVASVNDRSLITDNDKNKVVLGTGDILGRYDYITTKFGQKPNAKASAASDKRMYWWDGYVKALVCYSSGTQVEDLGLTKNITAYLDSGEENETPLVFYDKKYNEIVNSVVNNESIVYNEYIEQFTSVYKFMPAFYEHLLEHAVITKTVINQDTPIYLYNQFQTDEFGNSEICLFDNKQPYPYIKYVINNISTVNKVFDNQIIGGNLYDNNYYGLLSFDYTTYSQNDCHGDDSILTDREYDYRLAIPRNGDSMYGDRMRGKTMECEISFNTNNKNLSLDYIITKFRTSWS